MCSWTSIKWPVIEVPRILSVKLNKPPIYWSSLLSRHSYLIVFTPFNPLTPRAFCQKRIFWTFLRFTGWIRAKSAPIHSKRHLQQNSMPFFPLVSHFMTFLLGHVQKSKFWDSFWMTKWPSVFRPSFFEVFFVFSLSPFIFLLQWLTFYWSCFPFKNSQESIIKTGNLCYGR